MGSERGQGKPVELPLILIVEDDPQVARLLTTICAAIRACPVIASSKAEALALVRTERPQLVTLDMELPDGDGLDVARAMKNDPALSSVPAIAISSTGPASAALDAGCVDYVPKPFNGSALRSKILALLPRLDRNAGVP